jgi:hypothetical protein
LFLIVIMEAWLKAPAHLRACASIDDDPGGVNPLETIVTRPLQDFMRHQFRQIVGRDLITHVRTIRCLFLPLPMSRHSLSSTPVADFGGILKIFIFSRSAL